MSQIIGSIIMAGLLAFCLLALLIPVIVEFRKISSVSTTPNRTVVIFMTLWLLAVTATYLVVR